MRLEVESGRVIDDVAEADIRDLIEGEDFAILGDALHYMQCAEESREPRTYVLEYQDGALDRHFRALQGPFPLDRVVAAFTSYLRGDGSWMQGFTWTKVAL